MSKRFAVTGGRNNNDEAVISKALTMFDPNTDIMINGMCPTGADAIAKRVWESRGGKVEPYPADWKTHGKAAGFIRNQQMVDSGLDSVLVFSGGNGTEDMRRRCVRANVQTIIRERVK